MARASRERVSRAEARASFLRVSFCARLMASGVRVERVDWSASVFGGWRVRLFGEGGVIKKAGMD